MRRATWLGRFSTRMATWSDRHLRRYMTMTRAHRHACIRVGRQWTLVTYYWTGGNGNRGGWWCEDAAGGWGISRRGPEDLRSHSACT